MPRTKGTLIWVDDKPDERQEHCKAIAKALDLKMEQIDKESGARTWFDVVENIRPANIRLIIVDHNLSATSGDVEAFSAGSSLCSFLREKFIGIPIIGVSAATKNNIPVQLREEYVNFFELTSVLESLDEIRSIVSGFECMRRATKRNNKRLCDYLSPLPYSRDMIEKLVPVEFRSKGDLREIIPFYKWCKHVLFRFVGALISPEYIAASIGVTKAGFDSLLKPKLVSCKYTGVFSCERHPLYWKRDVYITLAGMAKDAGNMQVSHYGELLCGSNMLVKCPMCHKVYTEVLASEEDYADSSRMMAAHYGCVRESRVPVPAFFEPQYVLDEG